MLVEVRTRPVGTGYGFDILDENGVVVMSNDIDPNTGQPYVDEVTAYNEGKQYLDNLDTESKEALRERVNELTEDIIATELRVDFPNTDGTVTTRRLDLNDKAQINILGLTIMAIMDSTFTSPYTDADDNDFELSNSDILFMAKEAGKFKTRIIRNSRAVKKFIESIEDPIVYVKVRDELDSVIRDMMLTYPDEVTLYNDLVAKYGTV